MPKEDDRFSTAARDEAKALAKAEAHFADSERLIARQKVLLDEIRSNGLRTIEAESSLVRLEAAAADFRAQLDVLVAKAQQRKAEVTAIQQSEDVDGTRAEL